MIELATGIGVKNETLLKRILGRESDGKASQFNVPTIRIRDGIEGFLACLL